MTTYDPLRQSTDTLIAGVVELLTAEGYSWNRSTTSFSAYLATALTGIGGSTVSNKTMSTNQLLAGLVNELGGSVSHLTSSRNSLLAALASSDGGGGGGDAIAPAIHWMAFDGNQVLKGNITFPATATAFLVAGFVGNVTGDPNTSGGGGFFFNIAGSGVTQLYVGVGGVGDGSGQCYLQCKLSEADGTVIVDFFAYPVSQDIETGFHTFAISANSATQTLQFYVDRVAMDVSGATWSSSNPFGFAANDPYVVDTGSSGEGVTAEMSNFVVRANNTFFDLSDTANMNKLFGADNKAIAWGTDITSGAQIYLKGDATNYGDNLGTGGALTPFNFIYGDGVITNATTSPSD